MHGRYQNPTPLQLRAALSDRLIDVVPEHRSCSPLRDDWTCEHVILVTMGYLITANHFWLDTDEDNKFLASSIGDIIAAGQNAAFLYESFIGDPAWGLCIVKSALGEVFAMEGADLLRALLPLEVPFG